MRPILRADNTIRAVRATRERWTAPLPKAELAELMRMLRVLVNADNELSRAPRGDG